MGASVFLVCTAVLLAYAVRVGRRGRMRMPRLGDAPGSALLPGWAVEAFYWALHAPGAWLARRGVSPDALTMSALGFSVLALPMAAGGRLAAAGAVVLLGASLDALDGMVARASGRATAAGAVLDSVTDRLADAAPLMGLALFYRRDAWALGVVLAALVASGCVSYTRAKGEIYGLRLADGLMRRHERVAYLSVSLLAAPWFPRLPGLGSLAFPLALAGPLVIACVGGVASIQLLRQTRAALRGREAAPAAAEATRAERAGAGSGGSVSERAARSASARGASGAGAVVTSRAPG